MRMTLKFVPPGEAENSLDFDVPNAPQLGDHITVRRSGQKDTNLVVKHTQWILEYPGAEKSGVSFLQIIVQCEFSDGGHSAEPFVFS